MAKGEAISLRAGGFIGISKEVLATIIFSGELLQTKFEIISDNINAFSLRFATA